MSQATCEIRPIRSDEAEAFLRMLCSIFSLDYERASRVFFTEPLFDIRRKWGLFERGELISILQTTGLEFGWGKAAGVAGVATRPDRRGEGFASQLLLRVMEEAQKTGESSILLFATTKSIYAKLGFEALDEVVRGTVDTERRWWPASRSQDPLSTEFVRGAYERWRVGSKDRLLRSEARWSYWNWNFRTCSPYRDGYVCNEGGVLRELAFTGPAVPLPLPSGTAWYGLRGVASALSLPIHNETTELVLMGRNVPGIPQMFMTDQF